MRAEILLRCGDVAAAASGLAAAAEHAPAHGDPYEPEVLRIRAEVAAANPATAGQAVQLLTEALVTAHAQGAGAFEQRVRAAVARVGAGDAWIPLDSVDVDVVAEPA